MYKILIYYVIVAPKRCDVDCGLGQECQWINGEEMCVCSEESCNSVDSLTSKYKSQPLCASNNMTFSSECTMAAWKCLKQQSGLYKKYDGECQSKKVISKKIRFYLFLFFKYYRRLSKCKMSI